MNTFKQFVEKKELINYLIENNYNQNDVDLEQLIREGFYDKWVKPAVAATGIAAAGIGSIGSTGNNQAIAGDRLSVSTTRSQAERSSISAFWKKDFSGNYTPIRGNSILLKQGVNISNDAVAAHAIDQTFYNARNAATTNGSGVGHGLNQDEAIADALSNIGRQMNGIHVSSNTVVKNDELEKDDVKSRSSVIVRSFKIDQVKENKGLFTVNLTAVVQSSEINNQGNIDNLGKFSGPNITRDDDLNKKSIRF